MKLEPWFLTKPRGLTSRLRLLCYRLLGLKMGRRNRMEGGGRCRRLRNIEIGDLNAFTQGAWLWPIDLPGNEIRIRIGHRNYFNRNVMLDANGLIEIGNDNLIGPDVYMADSNHTFGPNLTPSEHPMQVGQIKIGHRCWIGAKAVILKNVELGDGCVVAAGAVVTKSFPPDSIIGGVPARSLSILPKH